MKATGMVRKIDDLGRLVIPKEIRKAHGWEEHMPMEMFMTDEGMVIRAYQPNGEKQRVVEGLSSALNRRATADTREAIERALAYLKTN